MPLVLLIVCSSTGIAHAADDADKPKRGDEFLLFRETQVELPGGDSRTCDRGTRGRVIQVEGLKVVAMIRGAKVEVPLDNIVSGRAGIARVTDAIRRNPADWAFRLIRADLYCNAGDFRAAIADVDAVPRDSDIFRHALFARAMIQYQVRNWQEMVNSLIECRVACEKANDKNMMTSVSAWTGMAKCKLGQHAEAVADFDTAIAGGMDDAQTNSWRANALQELGRIDEVIKSLRRAVELDPDDEKIRVRLILAVKNVSGTAAALAEADRFIEESPRAANPFVVRATLQLLVGDASAALADAEQAIRTEPQHVEAHFAKAKVLLVQNKHDELRDFCDALKELELVKAEHFSYRSYYFYGCDMPDDALADANKAVDGGIRDANLFLTRARIYGAREDWPEVISNATRAIELDQRDSEAYAWRFTARFQTNELDLALADINRAISLSDNESSYFSYRAAPFSSPRQAPRDVGRFADGRRSGSNRYQGMVQFYASAVCGRPLG